MMKMRIFIYLLSVALASAQPLWRATSYGMSVDDVLRAVPEARPSSENSKLGDGASEKLRVENFEVVNRFFDVKFYFLSEKLVQVTLSLKTNKGEEFQSVERVFEGVADVLRAKYGKEISLSRNTSGIVKLTRGIWKSDKTNISVLVMGVGTPLLNINYQLRISEEADKL